MQKSKLITTDNLKCKNIILYQISFTNLCLIHELDCILHMSWVLARTSASHLRDLSFKSQRRDLLSLYLSQICSVLQESAVI